MRIEEIFVNSVKEKTASPRGRRRKKCLGKSTFIYRTDNQPERKQCHVQCQRLH